MTSTPERKMWGGRFDERPDAGFYEFQRSFHFDVRLLPFELNVDRAWARALVPAGILTREESESIVAALGRIEARAKNEQDWLRTSPAEDVHSFVESALIESLGPVGAKLHTGRSRNEMVATEFRLFIKEAAKATRRELGSLLGALLGQAETHPSVPMPGNTHMQHAQPILFSHFLLAHAEAFFHDVDRVAFAANTANACPMGAGALAGCAFPVDRLALARDLGFERITRNSLDAVSRRDFVLDYLFALTVIAGHLSRLAEDFILFAAPEFGFLTLADRFSTGSSLMPQKKNPDVFELIRGKAGRITGSLVSLLTTLKGLPSGYQRDLQEDKEPVFAAHDQTVAMLAVAAGALAATRVNEKRMREAAGDPALLATEAADYLVARGVPFRDAHETVGRICRDAEASGETWTALPVERLKSYSSAFGSDVRDWLTLDSALARRSVPGGTAPATVRAAIAECRERLAKVGETP